MLKEWLITGLAHLGFPLGPSAGALILSARCSTYDLFAFVGVLIAPWSRFPCTIGARFMTTNDYLDR